ncbi:MAG: TPM domain-containing protein [Chromatiaceae bacterium]|jgi:tetratricopeptide (TPR) repeat protein
MRKPFVVLILSVVAVIGGAVAWSFVAHKDDGLPADLAAFDLETRPQSNRYLFDYAGALRHYEEGAHHYLARLMSRFQIEALIVSVPALPVGKRLETLAVDLVNQWRIGAQHEGRGLLLLLVDETKQVKLEVGYALEDVFTDAFSGYVEDLQLGPYYRAGDIGTGLIAVMEMLEERAQVKNQGDYSPEFIAQSDAALLAGGAGAARDLPRYATDSKTAARPAGRGARSPEEAWEIMLDKWAGDGADIDIDPYTEMTRLAMGPSDKPDPRTTKWLEHWREADYQVLRDGDYAVIWFGAIDGWENSPFLFCNTGDGWKFDIVWQRRLVVMADNPKWQVAQGPYPYVGLMREAWQSTGKDLPLSREDLYRCADDSSVATRMAELHNAIDRDPADASATLELLRLSVNTNQRPAVVRPLIEQAKRLAPDRAEPWKYSALYNVTAFFQYRTALGDIERFIALRPDDPFGHDVKGFLLYRLGEYQDSIASLERAAELNPDDGYAYALMARDYALLARATSGLSRERYEMQARAMRRKAEAVPAADGQRLAWLDSWLSKWL